MYHFASFLLQLNTNLLVKSVISLNADFAIKTPGYNFSCASCILCYHAIKLAGTFQILQLFLFCHNLYWGWLA
jgi:hypothetical protein